MNGFYRKTAKKENQDIYVTLNFDKIDYVFFIVIQRGIIVERRNFHQILKLTITKRSENFKLF